MKIKYFLFGFITAVILGAATVFIYLYFSGFGKINPAIKDFSTLYSVSATITGTKEDKNGLLLQTDIPGSHPNLYVTNKTAIVIRQDNKEVKASVTDLKPGLKADLYLSYAGNTREYRLNKVSILTSNLPKVSTSSATSSAKQK